MIFGTGKGERRVYPLTEVGNADLLAEMLQGKLLYVKGREWFAWEDDRWTNEGEAVIKLVREVLDARHDEAYGEEALVTHQGDTVDQKKARKWYRRTASKKGIRTMLDIAKDLPGMSVDQAILDSDPFLLGVANGVVDLQTLQLRIGRPEDLITHYTKAAFDPEATCPRWEQFIFEIALGREDYVSFIQEFCGYSISGLISEHSFNILLGNGHNGKSTLIEVLTALMGDYSVGLPGNAFLASNTAAVRNDLARLPGKRFVSAAEVDTGAKLAESNVKRLTGGDTFTTRFLYKENFDFKPQCKFVLSVNTHPTITGADNGIYRRLVVFPFDADFSDGDDKTLPEKLQQELSGILNWCLAGFKRFHERGHLEYPDCVKEAGIAYRELMDITQAFLDDRCERVETENTPMKQLYEQFAQWCDLACITPVGKQRFTTLLMQKGFRHKKSGSHNWIGIKLLKKDEVQRVFAAPQSV